MNELASTNKLKEAIKGGNSVVGPFMKLGSPAVVEIMGHAGFDFVIIDLEHGPLSMESAENMVRAATLVGVTPVIRVGDNDPLMILRALDIGAQGIQIPHINSREAAGKAVRASKYAPEGDRGVCRYVKAANYSAMDRYEYFQTANRETMVIIHIEGQEGVENLDEILTVDGVDVIFLGPYDLSQSLGVPGQVDHPLVLDKMKEVVERARKAGRAMGTFVDDMQTAYKWMNLGVQYISYAVDVGILYKACLEIVKGLKGLV